MTSASLDSTSADRFGAERFGAPTFVAFEAPAERDRAQAAALYDRLVEIGFDEARVPAMFRVRSPHQIAMERSDTYDAFVLPRDAAGDAARFFVLGRALPEEALDACLGAPHVCFLRENGALAPADGGWRSVIALTWLAGRLIATDARAFDLVWPQGRPFADLVMFVGEDTAGLVNVAPRDRRRSALDLCCGSGSQSLVAAAYSDTVTGVDVNPRALRFARFNAAANRVANVHFVRGDLYDALPPGRFDAILANPPFVPWPASAPGLLYRDGGPRGDDVLRRIFAGALERLEPDGRLSIVTDVADAEELATRILAWQGGVRRRTLIVVQRRFSLVEYAEGHAGYVRPGRERSAEIARLIEHFGAMRIRAMDLCYLLQDGRPGTIALRATAAPVSRAVHEDVAGWFTHHASVADGIADEARLVLAPGVVLVTEERRSARGTQRVRAVATAPDSILESFSPSATQWALLERIAGGETRLGDVPEAERTTLSRLIDDGIVRVRA